MHLASRAKQKIALLDNTFIKADNLSSSSSSLGMYGGLTWPNK